ncbi:hypothetical protein ACQ86O_27745 (plasmid) [Serratia sp. L9]|uniref:hypothetical protein n=1 Tax=Serratia sp. L9 TaxID=3423946 RepID=UPI003D679F18
MMKVSFPCCAFLGTLLLGNSIQPTFADTVYRMDLSNCSISDIGNNQWKVVFDMTRMAHQSGANIHPNTSLSVQIKIPTISGTGLSSTNFVWNPVPIKDLTLPAGVVTRGTPSYYSQGITLGPPTGDLILTTGGHVTFIITPTVANKAYPAAAISTTAANDGGSVSGGTYWFIPTKTNGTCIRTSGSPSVPVPPITEVMPPEPEFKMSTAKWVLDKTDVGDLPDVTASSNGYLATIQNINSNNLCVNYVLAGVKKNTYALSVSNTPSTQGGRSLFTMHGPDSSQLFYNLKLKSSVGGSANDYKFPASGTTNYISLQQGNDIGNGRSQMCWTPEINLFKSASTKAGMHTDSLNFIITPNT